MPKHNSEMSAEDRRWDFHETYGNELDAEWTLVHLVTGCGKFLETIVGAARANAGMAEIIRDLADTRSNPQRWAAELADAGNDAFSEWPLGQELHDLTAYAIYGFIFKEGGSEDERQQFLESKIHVANQFLASAPIAQWVDQEDRPTVLERLMLLVNNRWALDNSRPVEPAALAWFGDITEGSIRNMMSGEKRTFTNEDGKIPAHEALAWLSKRQSFWNSIWREQEMERYSATAETGLSRPVFVPVSRDGSVFNPGLLRASGFTIGAKGSEQQKDSFWDALVELQSMSAPMWRRPNDKGNWGIVRGVRWVRVEVEFLEKTVATTPNFRLPENFTE